MRPDYFLLPHNVTQAVDKACCGLLRQKQLRGRADRATGEVGVLNPSLGVLRRRTP